MIEEDLFLSLKDIAPTYPMILPQNATFPALTYSVVTDIPHQALYGNIFERDARFQVDVWAESYSEAKSLKDTVINKIIELKGGDISSIDLYEEGTLLYRQLIDFTIRR